MISIFAKLFSYHFVLLIYAFILKIIKMVYTDIRVMSRKKTGAKFYANYFKLLNLRDSLDFSVAESYEIRKNAVIGRSSKCDIRIDDPFMSQQHAEVLLEDGVFYLSDLESTNGTYLNGEEVTGDPIEMRNGDKVEIGQLTFIFVSEKSEGDEDDAS